MSQLRAHAEITLVGHSRQDHGHVALFLASTVDRTTLQSLSALIDARARVVLVVDRMREADVLGVVGCGVTSIVWRRAATSTRLLRAIRAAHQGETNVPSDLVGTLVACLGRRKGQASGSAELTPIGMTPREIDVLRLVSEGLDTGEIAAKLAYSERAVKYILQHLTSRLQLRNRSHAVAYALRAGYI
ncbi:helix-turn-helix transcriptional regulator [Streptomyces flavofungini]|uniref:helix-turn-helix transcriptional regulator n=1 Tax=Streptomyces flavofungini TaxID=68200 RepID=UPI001E38FF66|nr:response regulator transcription factor [Streptomyces flavofungini]